MLIAIIIQCGLLIPMECIQLKNGKGIKDEDIQESYTVSDTKNAESSSNNEENGGSKKRNTSDKTQNTKSGGSWFTQDDIPVWCWARKVSNDWENGDYVYTVCDVLMGVVHLSLIWVPGDIAGRFATKTGVSVIGPRATYC